MSTKRWVVVSSFGFAAALSCAEAEDQKADFDQAPDDGGSSGSGGSGIQGGKTSTAGSSAQGGKVGTGGNGGAGGKGGAAGTTGNHAGTATEGGRAGSTSNEGGETGSGGSTIGGSGSTPLGCVVEAAGGAGGVGVAGEAAGGAAEPAAGGATSAGAAGADAGLLALFFDDFEAGSADKWTPSGGAWAISDDGGKVYEQSLLENKLQIAIANDVCVADQIIEARVKVTEFKGQSNSYVAALFGRALSQSTHYLLALGSDKKLILRKRINSASSSATAIGSSVALTVATDQWYDLRFELSGTSLKGCVGDVCVTGTDSAIASGSIGVGTVNTSARFDDVKVTAP